MVNLGEQALSWFSEMRELWRTVGPARFFLILGCVSLPIVAFGTTGWWLEDQIGWPEAYGFQCRGRGCLLENLWHSHKLLNVGSYYEVLLFAWIWFIPAATVILILVILARRRIKRRAARIRPLE